MLFWRGHREQDDALDANGLGGIALSERIAERRPSSAASSWRRVKRESRPLKELQIAVTNRAEATTKRICILAAGVERGLLR